MARSDDGSAAGLFLYRRQKLRYPDPSYSVFFSLSVVFRYLSLRFAFYAMGRCILLEIRKERAQRLLCSLSVKPSGTDFAFLF